MKFAKYTLSWVNAGVLILFTVLLGMGYALYGDIFNEIIIFTLMFVMGIMITMNTVILERKTAFLDFDNMPPPKPEPVKQEMTLAEQMATFIVDNLDKGVDYKTIKHNLMDVGKFKEEEIDGVVKAMLKKNLISPESIEDKPEEETVEEQPKEQQREIKTETKYFDGGKEITEEEANILKNICPKCKKQMKTPGALKNHMRLSKKCQSS